MAYDIVPGVDENNQFPLPIQTGLVQSTTILSAIRTESENTANSVASKMGDMSLLQSEPVIGTEDFIWGVSDKAGNVALGVKKDGSIYPNPESNLDFFLDEYSAATKSDRSRIAVLGDSLSFGFYGGQANADTNKYSWPTVMSESVTSSINNASKSGWTTDAVALYSGLVSLPLNGTIPESTNATIMDFTNPSGFALVTGNSIVGTLDKLKGTLTATASGFRFVPTPNQSTATVVNPFFVADTSIKSTDTLVIFLGRNDVYQKILGTEGNTALHIFNSITRIVDNLTPRIKRFLIISVTTGVRETSGTANYNIVKEANDLLRNKYGGHFFDLREYLVNKAIYDLNITPTADDLQKMAGDTLPPSIMDPGRNGLGDGTHYSKDTAVLVANKIKEELSLREWVNV